MSAVTQNCTYIFGKKKKDAKSENVLSAKKLEEIKKAVQKYRPDNK